MWSGDFKDAEIKQQQALKTFRAAVPRNHPEHTVALATLGYILTQNGKFAQAEQSLTEASDIERSVFGADNQRLASIDADLGVLYARTGDLPRALTLMDNAVKIATQRDGPEHFLRGYYLDSRADIRLQNNDIAGAEADAQQALGIYARTLPARHLYVASSRQLLGEILLRRGLLADAERELRSAVDIETFLVGADNWRTVRTEATLSWVLIKSGRDAQGEPMLAAAQRKLVSTLGSQHPEAEKATTRLAQYYREHHRDADLARVLATGEHH
jgi:tetratricopeptide (TPR) repeat protein